MLDIRKMVCVALPAVLLCLGASSGRAQEAAADKAKALLQQGLEQFQAKQYKEAQATLMTQAAWDTLLEDQKKQRDDCLDKVGPAFKAQTAAEEALASGAKALEGNQLAEAEKAFAEAAASQYLPDAKRKTAQDQLALVRQRQTAAKAPRSDTPGGPASAAAPVPSPAPQAAPVLAPEMPADNILNDLEIKREVQRKKAMFDIAEAAKRAQEILARAASATEFEAAASAVTVAENVLSANKGLFTPNAARQQQDEIDQLHRHVELNKAAWERNEVNRTRLQIEVADRVRKAQQEEGLRREIARYTSDAQAAIRRKDYPQALDLLDKVLKIDPSNEAVRSERFMLEQIALLQQEKGYSQDEARERQKQLIDLREAEIPWYELLRYPRDWREITLRREPFMATAAAESEQNRSAIQKLKRKVQEAKFENQEFKAVVDWLQQVSNLSIHVKWSALETGGIQATTLVKSVHLTDVSVEKVLRTVLDDVGGTATALTYVVDEGVVTVSTRDDLNGPRYLRTLVYDITDLLFTVPSFNAPRITLNIGSGNQQTAGGCNFFCNAQNATNNNVADRSVIVNGILSLITRTIDNPSWMTPWGNGQVGSINEMNGQLVVTQTPENHRLLLDLINQLREAKALQITIECRFLTVSTGFLNSIGLDLQTFFNIGSTLGAGGSVIDPVTGAAVPLRGTNAWQSAGEFGPGHQNFTPMGIRQDTMTFGTTGLASPISGGIASIGSTVTTPSLSVGGTFLDDIQVDFLIQATQANQMARSVTAPRITIFNGQRGAYVAFGTSQAYVASLTPVISGNVFAYTPTIGSIPTGTVLSVDEATVSADRRYVVMTVSPTISQLNGFTTYFTIVTATDPNGNPITGTGYVQLPNVTVEEIRTTVSVPDGGTLLLGGQKASGELEREKGAPLLSKIPVLNRLFTNRGKVRDEQTILILIKPRIIIHREEEERAFPP